eukprot:gene11492-12684_t
MQLVQKCKEQYRQQWEKPCLIGLCLVNRRPTRPRDGLEKKEVSCVSGGSAGSDGFGAIVGVAREVRRARWSAARAETAAVNCVIVLASGSLSEGAEVEDWTACTCAESTSTERPSDITAVLLDGAAIVHMVSPLSSRNFQDYEDNEMASFFKTILANRDLRRLDLVFDVYRESSIKEGAREKRGTGSRIKKTSLYEKSRPIDVIPPTKDALHQYSLRAAYQAGLKAYHLIEKPKSRQQQEEDASSEDDSDHCEFFLAQPQRNCLLIREENQQHHGDLDENRPRKSCRNRTAPNYYGNLVPFD